MMSSVLKTHTYMRVCVCVCALVKIYTQLIVEIVTNDTSNVEREMHQHIIRECENVF